MTRVLIIIAVIHRLDSIHQVALAGDDEETFRSSSQAATCRPAHLILVYHTVHTMEASPVHTVPLIAKLQQVQ